MKPSNSAPKTKPATRRWLPHWLQPPLPRWVKIGLALAAVPVIAFSFAVIYYYVTFGRLIDERLHGERERVLPRVYARPFELRRGQSLTEGQLVDRLNDLGYTLRARIESPGEFESGRSAIVLIPRDGTARGRRVRVVFARRPASAKPTTEVGRVERLELGPKETADAVTLESPLLTALMTTARQKRRQVPLTSIPPKMVQAVLAIEDRRFYDHPGVDPIRMIGAALSNLRGDRAYLTGASTITQQLIKNFFLTPEKTLTRKLLEQFMALILERRATKDEILELYLNEVYLGQRGSFAIHGVAEAARLFFGKDVTNVTLSEAAAIAGVIQSPGIWSPFNARERAKERRNVVLQAMAEAGYVSQEAAARTALDPLVVVQRAIEAEAPYFVDFVGEMLAEQYPGLTTSAQALDVYTTLDLHLQRLAQDAVRDGLTRVDDLLAKRRRRRPPAQAALIAVDPRSGEILALVGGRSYNQSQYNRAVAARRQPGSVFKPFVYLAAFDHAADEGTPDWTPASLVTDEPTTFSFEEKAYSPSNYENEYDGEITLRRALAMSRNVATVKVAEATGFDQVALLWKRLGIGTPPRPYPSIALGVFEATPFEIATAYTIFPNGGQVRPLRAVTRLESGGQRAIVPRAGAAARVARADAAFLVTNMMRSVLNEGTGAGARAAGFALDAAGKSGTTNDLRDAWFVGFTPELLTVVWVGLDDNQPLGLSGSQAALPIWTPFMMRALAGRPNQSFGAPDGVTFVEIDRDTGKVAGPACPRVFSEAFLAGTEPYEICELHRF